MKKSLHLTILFFMLSVFAVNAQDLIYKKNKEVVLAKILEIGVDEIKYKEFNNLEGPTIAIDKNEVAKIKYENGKEVIMVSDGFSNPNQYADNKKNALKIDFLAPMFGQTTFGYERSVKPGMSFEVQLGIIGLGADIHPDVNATGGFGRVGYKFIRTPDYYMKGMRYAHVLKGSYIRPEITFGAYNEDIKYDMYGGYFGKTNSWSQKITFGAIMLNFGKQWVFSDIFLVDYFFGIGYGFTNKDMKSSTPTYTSEYTNYAISGPFQKTPLAFNAGLKVGILIK